MGSVEVIAPTGPPGQPDIAYTPNWHNYQARVQRRRETEQLEKKLPSGFPQKLDSSLAWHGSNVLDSYAGEYKLTLSDLEEIAAAVKHFQDSGKPLGELSQETFPLSNLHSTLRSVSDDIHNGHGFKVIQGVPVKDYTREENIIIYAGLAAHVASIRGRQDTTYKGQPADVVLAHIKDLSQVASASSIGSPAYTTEKQVYHTDRGDIISLFALDSAEEGGQSYLSSSWAVYNKLAATRPDLIKTLSEPWDVDNFGKSGSQGYSAEPILYHQPATQHTPERVIFQYARRTFTGYWGLPRSSNIPAITEAQAEALDALHYTAEELALTLDFKPGDIQFVNNLSIFHARNGFRDSPNHRRHLMRLWLRDEELAWKTPEQLQHRWDSVYKDVTPDKQVFPLEPYIRTASSGKRT